MERPSASDCCNSGCNPCILDVYEEQLKTLNDKKLREEVDSKENCMSPTRYERFQLVQIIQHTHDTLLLTFAYINKIQNTRDVCLIHKPGQHFLLKGYSYHDENKSFTRAYTPIPIKEEGTSPSEPNFTIVIKLYHNGSMSQCIKKLNVGNETLWRGPYGNFEINYNFENILLIAQGTGIAPLFAIIDNILNNLNCNTFLKLYYCCRTDEDILLRDKLYMFTSYWNFSYEIFLSDCMNCSPKYKEVVHNNRLNKEFVGAYLKNLKDKNNIQILICGNDQFNKDICSYATNCDVHFDKIFVF